MRDVMKVMQLRSDIKIELMQAGLNSLEAYTLSENFIQKLIDSDVLRRDVQEEIEKMLKE